MFEHKTGKGNFTNAYNCKLLLYYETFTNVFKAIAREKQLKKYAKEWKFSLICKQNPEMKDLAATWFKAGIK